MKYNLMQKDKIYRDKDPKLLEIVKEVFFMCKENEKAMKRFVAVMYLKMREKGYLDKRDYNACVRIYQDKVSEDVAKEPPIIPKIDIDPYKQQPFDAGYFYNPDYYKY